MSGTSEEEANRVSQSVEQEISQLRSRLYGVSGSPRGVDFQQISEIEELLNLGQA
jgi:hypothetical protein